jgi:tetratricopeptide (TPR) repeat protein
MDARLSAQVCQHEATVFAEFADFCGQRKLECNPMAAQLWKDLPLLSWVEQAVAEALSISSVCASIKGSVGKGTQLGDSDTDIVIETPGRDITKADQIHLVSFLKQLDKEGLHPEHIRLKKVAIHVVYMGGCYDLVFANNATYGTLPATHDHFYQNPAAQNAARMLKFTIRDSTNTWKDQITTVPGFVLELLALEAQSHLIALAPQEEMLGDGSMCVFVHALQLLVDTPEILNTVQLTWGLLNSGSHLVGKTLSQKTKDSASKIAADLLHTFCMSRVFIRTQQFRHMCDIECWVRGASQDRWCESCLGKVPTFFFEPIATSIGTSASLYHWYNEIEKCSCVQIEKMSESEMRERLQCSLAVIFSTSGLSKYCLNMPQVRCKAKGCAEDDLFWSELEQNAAAGSLVAERMLVARRKWLAAETLLAQRETDAAVKLFGEALYESHADSDWFSGYWHASIPVYIKAGFEVLDSHKDNTDARLLLAAASMMKGMFSQSIEILSEGLALFEDHRLMEMRYLVKGNLALWKEGLDDVNRCIQLQPEKPIHYYFRAVFNSNTNPLNFLSQNRSDLLRFLKDAPQEGRKVSEARFRIATDQLLCTNKAGRSKEMSMSNKSSAVQKEFMELVEQAVESEQAMLPVVRRYEERTAAQTQGTEAMGTAKGIALRMYKLFKSGKPKMSDMISHNQMKVVFQHQVAQGDYDESIITCDLAIESGDSINAYRWYSNRSLALFKLYKFKDATEAAKRAISLKPDWAKGYLRLAAALLAQGDGPHALEAAEAGLQIAASTDLEQIKAESELICNYQVNARFEVPFTSYQKLTDCSFQYQQLERRGDQQEVLHQIKQSDLWPRVRFQEAVLLVCPGGSGDHLTIHDALQCTACEDKPCSIVLIGMQHSVPGTIIISRSAATQILAREAKTMINFVISDATSIFVIEGRKTEVWFENLCLGNSRNLHCVFARNGAKCHLLTCEFRARDASVCICGDMTSAVMHTCTVRAGSGSGIMAREGAHVSATHCAFLRTRGASIEARSRSSIEMKHSSVTGSLAYGASLYDGGSRLHLEDCAISNCGRNCDLSAVLVRGGEAVMRRCNIFRNRGDAIVLQGDGQAKIQMRDCHVHTNERSGVCIYQGSGRIENCQIMGNAMQGLVIIEVLHGRRVHVIRNQVQDNGSMIDIMLAGRQTASKVTFDMNRSSDVIWVAADNVEIVAHHTVPGDFETFKLSPHTGAKIYDGEISGMQSFLESMVSSHRAQYSSEIEHDPQDITFMNFNRDRLVAGHQVAWKAAKKHDTEVRGSKGSSMVTLHMDFGSSTYQTSANEAIRQASTTPLKDLQRCRITDLVHHLGRRTPGRVLFGTLVTNPIKMVGAGTIFVDDSGDAVRLALYDMPSCVSWYECVSTFPRGLRLCLKEPYLKRSADGGVGIRVGHADDVCICCALQSCTNVSRVGDDAAQVVNCTKCKVVYCSSNCQVKHRKEHTKSCQSIGTLGISPLKSQHQVSSPISIRRYSGD